MGERKSQKKHVIPNSIQYGKTLLRMIIMKMMIPLIEI